MEEVGVGGGKWVETVETGRASSATKSRISPRVPKPAPGSSQGESGWRWLKVGGDV